MQETIGFKFTKLEDLLNKYESVGINIEEKRKSLNKLNQEYNSTLTLKSKGIMQKNKESKELLSEIEYFILSLKIPNNYYKIITTTKYLKNSIKSVNVYENFIDDYVEYIIEALKLIDECDKEQILKEEKMLKEFYSVALEVSELEMLYNKNHTNRILEFITHNENLIHISFFNKAIEMDIEEKRKSTYANPRGIKILENVYNRKQINYPKENLVSEEVIMCILACNDYEKIKKILKENIKRIIKEIEKLNEVINSYCATLDSNEETIKSYKSQSIKARNSMTKLLAALLGIVTPISIIGFKSSDKIAEITAFKEKFYETTTQTYSVYNEESEVYKKVLETVTWEKRNSSPASRTIEVLGNVKIVDGTLKRDYTLYDISSCSFDTSSFYTYANIMINTPEELASLIIDKGTRDASASEYKYSDIIITETIQDLENSKEVPKESKLAENKILINILVGLLTLLFAGWLIIDIFEKTKTFAAKSKHLKAFNKDNLDYRLTLMNLFTENTNNIDLCSKLCRDLLELIDNSEITKEEKRLIEKLEELKEEDTILIKKLNGKLNNR